MRSCRIHLFLVLIGLMVLVPSVFAQPITLTLWENADPLHMQATLRAVAQFEAENPNIKVDVQPYTNISRIDKLLLSVMGGGAPDIVASWGAEFKWLAAEGILLDIAPYMERYMTEEDLADFFPAQMAFFRHEEGQYALPRYAGTVATLVNQTLFDQAGLGLPRGTWTIDEFVEISKQLTQDPSGDGVPDQYGFVFLRFQDRLGMSIRRAGGSLLRGDDIRSFGLDTPESLQALKWLQDLLHVHRVSPPPGTEANWRLQGGRVAMEENGPWQISHARLYEVPFDFNVIEPPVGPNGPVSYLGSDGYAIVSSTRYPEEAFKLLEFLAGPYASEQRALVAGLQPSRRSIAQAWVTDLSSSYPGLRDVDWLTFLRVAEYAEPEPYFHNYADVWTMLTPALNRIWMGEPVEPVIQSVAGPIRALLEE